MNIWAWSGRIAVLGITVCALVTSAWSESSLPSAAVFTNGFAEGNVALARELSTVAQDAGFQVQWIDTPALLTAHTFAQKRPALLVLPDARALPAEAERSIQDYLLSGGSLIAAGLPAWQKAVFEMNGRWLTREEYERTVAAQRPERLLFDFAREDVAEWKRSSNDPRFTARAEIIHLAGTKTLHVAMTNLNGWETLASPNLVTSIPAGQSVTCFRAKGGPNTSQLAVEWTERDGSRWIATVALTPEWKDYAQPAEAFRAWQPPSHRAGPNDHLNMENAVRFVVGLALTHTPLVGGRHEYWIQQIGTVPNPFGDARQPREIQPPQLETFSAAYEFFPVTPPVTILTPAELALVPPAKIQAPDSERLFAMQPRPRSAGFDQRRSWRWQPLLEARAKDGAYRGAMATLAVHFEAQARGGIWACFTPAELKFYQQPEVRKLLRKVAADIQRGVFLREGGAEYYTVFEDQQFRLGARAVNLGRTSQDNLSLRLAVRTKSGKTVFTRQTMLSLEPGEEKGFEEFWRPPQWPHGGLMVTTELLTNGKVVDRLAHELNVWRPKAKPDFIEARDGGLWLRGKPWKAHGVNYMPSSGIGLADNQHFEYWVSRGAYDPDVIERDLRRIKAMNLNAVSVFVYHESLGAQHMLDFLRRCESLGVHLNLSLRPGTPLEFRWNEIRELIEDFRLAQNDTVFAYDLAWEPRHGSHDEQQAAYGASWLDWVRRRYGGLEAAQAAWTSGTPEDFKSQIGDLKPSSVPPMKWLTQDGPWRNCISDYRLFLDELLREKYGEARRLVKSVDPHHAVSFRMQHAGDSTFNWDAFLPYDFYGLADAVDIWEPEAYGRIGDWEKVKPGRFTSAYARLCDATKPLIWAEMGCSVWDDHRMSPAAEKLKFQARYFSDFYRMLNDSEADGIFFWWYPGGYRLNERSDFGIINPDGTDRLVTKIIRTEGGRFLDSHKLEKKPNCWIAVNRDRDARGIFGIYEASKEEFWQAIAENKAPGLKWEHKPGEAAQPTHD